MPRVPGGASGSRASTRWMMFSVRSCSPARDEDLDAADPVAAIRLGHGAGAQHAEVGAAMRLGQAHGAGPGAVHHLGKIGVFQLVAWRAGDRLAGAMRQPRIQTEGEVGGARHLLEPACSALSGRPWPPYSRISGKRGPAALAKRVVGFLEALGRAHDAVFQHGSLPRRPIALIGNSTSSATLAASSSTVSISSGRDIVFKAAELGRGVALSCNSCSTNRMSRRGAL